MKTSIILHHSGVSRSLAPRQYAIVDAFHERRWNNGGMQYHVFIEKDGEVFQPHRPEAVTYHAGSTKWNRNGIGVCLAGDFTQEQPTMRQLQSLSRTVISLQKRFGIADTNIKLHREVRRTQCPWMDFRKEISIERAYPIVNTDLKIRSLMRGIHRSVGMVRSMLKRQLQRLLRRI